MYIVYVYSISMKMLLNIPDADAKALDQICERQKISRSELIRRAAGQYIRQIQIPVNIEKYFGMWQNRENHNIHRVSNSQNDEIC